MELIILRMVVVATLVVMVIKVIRRHTAISNRFFWFKRDISQWLNFRQFKRERRRHEKKQEEEY